MTNHPASLIGTDVDVYWNLHKGAWSVRDRKTRLVVARVDAITLTDVQFKVSAAGNARVRSEGRKNVHAFARGTVASVGDHGAPVGFGPAVPVTYNPYKYTTFVSKTTDAPIHTADQAWLVGRAVWASA
jgi:hypothetical protein